MKLALASCPSMIMLPPWVRSQLPESFSKASCWAVGSSSPPQDVVERMMMNNDNINVKTITMKHIPKKEFNRFYTIMKNNPGKSVLEIHNLYIELFNTPRDGQF